MDFIDWAIGKHQEKLQGLARYIAGNYVEERNPDEVYLELVDAIRNGRGDIIEAWRFGYQHPTHIPLTPAASDFILGQILMLLNFLDSLR